MNVAVIGSGYVGLVVGACLAETGNDVCCADQDAHKIARLNSGAVPIYEPGLEEILRRNAAHGRLRFTTELETAIGHADVVFIAVGTPADEDGSADLSHVLAVAEVIGRAMRRELVVAIKSTVPVGTSPLAAEVIARNAQHPFHMCSNPAPECRCMVRPSDVGARRFRRDDHVLLYAGIMRHRATSYESAQARGRVCGFLRADGAAVRVSVER